jgi:membrane-associated protein
MLPGPLAVVAGPTLISWFIDLVLHLDKHLVELLTTYHVWIYPILFAVIFCETGLVVTPFLPGDSLLFAVGALAAVDTSGTLNASLLFVLLAIAAVLGNTLNYSIGRAIGPPAFSGRYRLLKVEYLHRTEDFFKQHGAMAVALSRFMPIIRTFAPFVAGVGRMPYRSFLGWNLIGGTLWVALFIWGGYLFGNIPVVKQNFGIVTLLIIFVSLIPLVVTFFKSRASSPA